MQQDEATLLDIAKAARLILDFTRELDKIAFMTDLKTQSAVLHQLLIIGEATKRLSRDFRAQHPQTPWTLMAGMRDVLIHAYDSVDLEEVWKTASKDVPQLLLQIKPLLPNQSD